MKTRHTFIPNFFLSIKLTGRSWSAAEEWIPRVTIRAAADSSSIPRLADSVRAAVTHVADVDALARRAGLSGAALFVSGALRPATCDRVGFGEEAALAPANCNTQHADGAFRVRPTRVWEARVVSYTYTASSANFSSFIRFQSENS